MRVLAILAVIYLASIAQAFEVSPTNPSPGDSIVITGTASPGQDIKFQSSFSMKIPVDAGRYEYAASRIEIPEKPNRFSVSAREIKDMNLGVKIGIWITKGFKASNGAAYISQSDIPSGRYDLKVFGSAADGVSSIPIEITAETQVRAGPDGKYKLTMDTSGLPTGDYRIQGAGETKVVRIGGSEPSAVKSSSSKSSSSEMSSGGRASSSGASSLEPSTSKKAASSIGITPEVIKWYAGVNSLDPADPEQYSEAERLLGQRTTGGYWKVIARGDPLTEQAGDCQDEYCLVRGAGACTSCRDEEMMIYASRVAGQTNVNESLNRTEIIAKPSEQNASPVRSPDREGSGLLGWILDIIRRMLGFGVGG